MSVITHVVIGDPRDAKKIREDVQLKSFIWEEFPDLSIAMLIGLLCLLREKRFSLNKKIISEFPILIDEATSVTKISDELVDLLSKMSERDFSDTATRWAENLKNAESAELIGPWDTFDGFESATVERFLTSLYKLSKKGLSRKKSLLLRQCS